MASSHSSSQSQKRIPEQATQRKDQVAKYDQDLFWDMVHLSLPLQTLLEQWTWMYDAMIFPKHPEAQAFLYVTEDEQNSMEGSRSVCLRAGKSSHKWIVQNFHVHIGATKKYSASKIHTLTDYDMAVLIEMLDPEKKQKLLRSNPNVQKLFTTCLVWLQYQFANPGFACVVEMMRAKHLRFVSKDANGEVVLGEGGKPQFKERDGLKHFYRKEIALLRRRLLYKAYWYKILLHDFFVTQAAQRYSTAFDFSMIFRNLFSLRMQCDDEVPVEIFTTLQQLRYKGRGPASYRQRRMLYAGIDLNQLNSMKSRAGAEAVKTRSGAPVSIEEFTGVVQAEELPDDEELAFLANL
ncbi:unnamed protein product [Amoebophrya sp. A120]|nr:unnamed protein product [Amoebophrya sp. A120]|eukprot:GSA120T00025884001.1